MKCEDCNEDVDQKYWKTHRKYCREISLRAFLTWRPTMIVMFGLVSWTLYWLFQAWFLK